MASRAQTETRARSVAGAARGCWRKRLTARPLFAAGAGGLHAPSDRLAGSHRGCFWPSAPPTSVCPGPGVPPRSHSPTLWTGSLLKPKRPIRRCWDGRVMNSRPLTPEHQIPSAATENANAREVVPARNRTRFVPLIIPLKRSLPLLLAERKSLLNTCCRTEPLKGKALGSPFPPRSGKSSPRGRPSTPLCVFSTRYLIRAQTSWQQLVSPLPLCSFLLQ